MNQNYDTATTSPNSNSHPPMTFDIFVYEREIRFIEGAGLRIVVLESAPGSDYVKIRITISSPYDLQMFAYANKTFAKEFLTVKRAA